MVAETVVLTEPEVGVIAVTVAAVALLTVNVVEVVPPSELRRTSVHAPGAIPFRLKFLLRVVDVSVPIMVLVMVDCPVFVRVTAELLKPDPEISIVCDPLFDALDGEMLLITGVDAIYVNAPVPVADDPPFPLVITTSFTPAVPAGVVAVIWVVSVQVTPVAAVPPMVTARELPDTKFEPVIVTAVPPAIDPVAGDILANVIGPIYVNTPGAVVLDAPSPFVITTSFAPAVPAGVTAVMWVASTKVTLVAAAPPTVTAREPPETKFVPVIVTVVPPAIGPVAGVMLVNVKSAVAGAARNANARMNNPIKRM